MITYKDIKSSVNNLLDKKFGIELNSNDVEKGFVRPSFFVSLDNPKRSSTLYQVEKSLTIRIYYFPKNREKNSIEIMDMQEQLESAFDLKLAVLDRKFNIIDVNSAPTDGVLEFSFDIAFSDGKEESNSFVDDQGNPIEIELMQTLDIKNEVN